MTVEGLRDILSNLNVPSFGLYFGNWLSNPTEVYVSVHAPLLTPYIKSKRFLRSWFERASEIQVMEEILAFIEETYPSIDVSQIEYNGVKIYLNREISPVVMRLAGLQSHQDV
jgi:hypothetical protein